MDERDFEILVGMLREPLASYQALGRGVGLSGTSVKNRLETMRDQGPLQGFVALPRAEVFDRASTIYWTHTGLKARDALEDVLEVDPVVWVNLLSSGDVAVHAYEGPDEDASGDIEDGLGSSLERRGGLAPWPGDVSDAVLSSLDWRILRHLVREPRMPVSELVEHTGLARNTVSKRRRRLFEEGLIGLFPLLEQARTPGLVLYSVIAHVHDEDDRSRVQDLLPGAVPVAHGVGEEGGAGTTFMGHADTIADVTVAHETVQDLDGVEQAQLVIDLERRVAVDRLEAWVEEEIERWEKR